LIETLPTTASISSRASAPSLKITGVSFSKPIMVDSIPLEHAPPSKTCRMSFLK